MKKKFLVLILGGILTCLLLSGCGNDSADAEVETMEKTDTEETEISKQAQTESETTGTWFENSGLFFTPAPEFSFMSSNYLSLSSGKTPYDVEMNAEMVITSSENGDGTKDIIATMAFDRWTDGNGEWSLLANYGFVDLYTGTSVITTNVTDYTISTEIEYAGQTYPISIHTKYLSYGDSASPSVRTITVTCPVEYEGTAFLVYGTNEEIDNNSVHCTFYSFDSILHGDYEILLFEGTDTEGADELLEEINWEDTALDIESGGTHGSVPGEASTTNDRIDSTPAQTTPDSEPQQPAQTEPPVNTTPVDPPADPDQSYTGGESSDGLSGTGVPDWAPDGGVMGD